MDIKELKGFLENKCVPPDSYTIGGGLPNEQYCIYEDVLNKKWEVYYSERGNKSGLKIFEGESEACNYFVDILRQDGFFR